MFKSWRETGPVTLAPLTGLFGANSSGKTSLLQLILMLKQTVESPDRSRVLHTGDKNSIVDLGTYYDLIYGHQKGQPLELSFSWRPNERLKIYDPEAGNKPLFEVTELSFTTSIHAESGRPIADSFRYTFGQHSFGMQKRNSLGTESSRKAGRSKVEYDLVCSNYDARRVRGRAWPLPAPVKCYGFPDEAVGYFQNTGFLPNLVLAFEEQFAAVAYLGPLRAYPDRSYLWAGDRTQDVGQRGEAAVPALLAARAENLRSGRGTGRGRRYKPIEARIAEWLKEMGLIDSFTLEPIAENRKDYELRVRKTKGSPEVLITDVGFGVSQILPVLVLCYYVPEGSTVLLEQPEIHLHPSVQTLLADVLIDVVRERGVQVIVESHSEHLLLRLQRRIAEGAIPLHQTELYFCRVQHDGSSAIDRLKVNLYGDIENWPEGFFGDEMGEHTARMQAAMNKGFPEAQ